MSAKIDLGVLKDPETIQCEADILNIIDEALNSSDDSATAAAKLADDLRKFFASANSEDSADTMLWNFWMLLLDVVRIVPIEHPWHNAIIAAINDLRKKGGHVVELEGRALNWAELPNLRMYIFDKWFSPISEDGCTPEEIEIWKRWTSFASQLLDDEFMPWILVAYWEIPAALETPPSQDATISECRLWAATEWLTHCAQPLYKDMRAADALNEQSKESVSGTTGDDIPLEIRRWEVWRSKLAELASKESQVEAVVGDSAGEGGDDAEQPTPNAYLSRIQRAIAAMDAASNIASGTDSTGEVQDAAVRGGDAAAGDEVAPGCEGASRSEVLSGDSIVSAWEIEKGSEEEKGKEGKKDDHREDATAAEKAAEPEDADLMGQGSETGRADEIEKTDEKKNAVEMEKTDGTTKAGEEGYGDERGKDDEEGDIEMERASEVCYMRTAGTF
ncbi:hypothetical protein QBC40DRAFT_274680 [Triangularia verruculosa]|uniref:Uncharacterized protein n=1 Tax=Triangularia verruculosa TaxID=2587418 RepID=A0AAN6XMI6_9PEZI|nr:hypothetical protein QBC40DRAFT_274680 [Triangularia verruculosa]